MDKQHELYGGFIISDLNKLKRKHRAAKNLEHETTNLVLALVKKINELKKRSKALEQQGFS